MAFAGFLRESRTGRGCWTDPTGKLVDPAGGGREVTGKWTAGYPGMVERENETRSGPGAMGADDLSGHTSAVTMAI